MSSSDPSAASQCPECAAARATVTDLPPTQHIPLPEDVLDHGPGAFRLSRRSLLRAGAFSSVAVYGSTVLGLDAILDSASAAAAGPDTCLVLLYLQGGNDGLGVAMPGTGAAAEYATYVSKRANLHRGQGPTPSGGRVGSQDIAGTGGLMAWSNIMLSTAAGGDNGHATYGFDVLWGDGSGGAGSDLAMLPSVDYTPGSLSHFDSSDYWFAGALAGMSTGWLGRWVDNNGTATNPLQAVSIDDSLSKAIRTASNPVCSIPATQQGKTGSLGFSMHTVGGYDMPPGYSNTTNMNVPMTNLSQAAAGPGNVALSRSRLTYQQGVEVAGSATSINGLPSDSATYPNPTSSLQRKLQLAARILAANLGTRIITIHWGNLDTHASQLAGQDPQMAELSRALSAFKADLAARGIERKVVTLAFSEFGRRVQENGSDGTDHGVGGTVLLSGSAVKGGLAGEPASLSALDKNGNLAVTTDFRSVYQSVLTEWLGGDLTGVLPSGPFPAINRHGGGSTLFK